MRMLPEGSKPALLLAPICNLCEGDFTPVKQIKSVPMRAVGYVLVCLGLLLAVVSVAHPFPSRVGLNGNEASTWVVLGILGFSLVVVGAAILLRLRHR